METDLHIVLHGEVVEQADVLEGPGNAHAVDLSCGLAGGIQSIQQDGAPGGLVLGDVNNFFGVLFHVLAVVDDLAQSIRFFQSPYAEDKMRLLNISVTATGTPEQIYNSVSGVERARCSFSVDFVQNTKEYAALHPQDGEYIADHDSAASKELADTQAGYFTEVEIEPQIKE